MYLAASISTLLIEILKSLIFIFQTYFITDGKSSEVDPILLVSYEGMRIAGC